MSALNENHSKIDILDITGKGYLIADPTTYTHRLTSVPLSNGAIALKCSNGKFLQSVAYKTPDKPYKTPEPVKTVLYPTPPRTICRTTYPTEEELCQSNFICQKCKFYPVLGNTSPITIRILNVEWGKFNDAIKSPKIVATDQHINYSDKENTQAKLTVRYSGEKWEKTSWEHAWGLSFTASAETEANAIIAKTTISFEATVSYNGKRGTESTTKEIQTVEKTHSWTCPPRTRCFFKLIGRKMDDQVCSFST